MLMVQLLDKGKRYFRLEGKDYFKLEGKGYFQKSRT